MEITVNSLLGALDDPSKDCRASVLYQEVGVVLNVTLAGKAGIERDDDKSPPRTSI